MDNHTRTIENNIREIKGYVNEHIFDNIIEKRVKFAKSFAGLSINFIGNYKLLEEEKFELKASIKWKPNEEHPKTPECIKIDSINLSGSIFLFAFLHECGHLQDYNEKSICLKTKKSEISAWKNAYNYFKKLIDSDSNLSIQFTEYVKKSLMTYNIPITGLENLLEIDLNSIKDLQIKLVQKIPQKESHSFLFSKPASDWDYFDFYVSDEVPPEYARTVNIEIINSDEFWKVLESWEGSEFFTKTDRRRYSGDNGYEETIFEPNQVLSFINRVEDEILNQKTIDNGLIEYIASNEQIKIELRTEVNKIKNLCAIAEEKGLFLKCLDR